MVTTRGLEPGRCSPGDHSYVGQHHHRISGLDQTSIDQTHWLMSLDQTCIEQPYWLMAVYQTYRSYIHYNYYPYLPCLPVLAQVAAEGLLSPGAVHRVTDGSEGRYRAIFAGVLQKTHESSVSTHTLRPVKKIIVILKQISVVLLNFCNVTLLNCGLNFISVRFFCVNLIFQIRIIINT